MLNMYFDETIQAQAGFIIGALIASHIDLSGLLRDHWLALGKMEGYEYKSSAPKSGDPSAKVDRDFVAGILGRSRLALCVCPVGDRGNLGGHCCTLVDQLFAQGQLTDTSSHLAIDDGISVPVAIKTGMRERGVIVVDKQDSARIAGLQVADHAAHILGRMLLRTMGLASKPILWCDDAGFGPPIEVDLADKLLVGLRYTLLGKTILSDVGDALEPTRVVDGYGLFVAPTCCSQLALSARQCFGEIYLGCMH